MKKPWLWELHIHSLGAMKSASRHFPTSISTYLMEYNKSFCGWELCDSHRTHSLCRRFPVAKLKTVESHWSAAEKNNSRGSRGENSRQQNLSNGEMMSFIAPLGRNLEIRSK